MDRIERKDLQSLIELDVRPCVSLFMPLNPAGRDGIGDAVRLRKLADDAEEMLTKRGLRRPEARELLASVRALPDDNAAWQRRGKSLAVFAAPGTLRVFHGNGRMEERAFVDDRFHVRPLIPHLAHDDRFFLLALSQNSVRLLEGNELGLKEIAVPGMPPNRDVALNIDEVPRGSQVHSAMRGDQGQGKQAGVFHGQGGKGETLKEDLRSFVRQVAQAVDKKLQREQAPLILATVELTVPIWRETSRYPYTTDAFVSGNPDYLSPHELHAKAWPLVQPALRAEREVLHRRLHEKENARAAFGLPQVVAAAVRGQIDSLFVDCSQPQWGTYDPESEMVDLHAQPRPGDIDLVELAVAETLRNGGRVFATPAPGASSPCQVEALLRY
jgi:hypothetical protein